MLLKFTFIIENRNVTYIRYKNGVKYVTKKNVNKIITVMFKHIWNFHSNKAWNWATKVLKKLIISEEIPMVPTASKMHVHFGHIRCDPNNLNIFFLLPLRSFHSCFTSLLICILFYDIKINVSPNVAHTYAERSHIVTQNISGSLLRSGSVFYIKSLFILWKSVIECWWCFILNNRIICNPLPFPSIFT